MSTTNTARKPSQVRVPAASTPGRNRDGSQAATGMLMMDLPPLEVGLRAMQRGQQLQRGLEKSDEGFFPHDLDDIDLPSSYQMKRPFWGVQEVICVVVSFVVGIPLGIWLGHWIYALPG